MRFKLAVLVWTGGVNGHIIMRFHYVSSLMWTGSLRLEYDDGDFK